MKKKGWESPYKGRYEKVLADGLRWVLEKHCDSKRWEVIDPEEGGVFDSHKTLAEAKYWAEIYAKSNMFWIYHIKERRS